MDNTHQPEPSRMAVTYPDPDKEGLLNPRIILGLQIVLTAALVLDGALTVVISPYYTISVMVILAGISLAFIVRMDSLKTKRYAERLTHERELNIANQMGLNTKPLVELVQSRVLIKQGKMEMLAQLASEFDRLTRDETLPAKDREAFKTAGQKLQELTRLVQTGL
jgi:hypothetical protein